MPEPDDITLLRQYARGDESAFNVLFERHVHLVYSTALRKARNPSHAEEITQAVFALLARKAKSLSPKTILSGWLYQAARLTAASLIKREIRRQRREQQLFMPTLTQTDTPIWEQISPLLDDAMGCLGEHDRNAIVLRFFENRTPQEMAATFRLNEAAARKRVSRALEKLRKFFARRGVVSTTAIIAGAISTNSVQAAPVTLEKAATAVALAKGATASFSTSNLIKGALKIMAWSNAKTAIAAGVAVLVVVGTVTIGGRIYVKSNKNAQPLAVSAARTHAPEAVKEQVTVIRKSLFPAIVNFAEAHGDQLPTSLADLKPYLSGNATDMDDDHWQIKAQGKLTSLLSSNNVIFADQKNVPFDEPRLIVYTDGHVERK